MVELASIMKTLAPGYWLQESVRLQEFFGLQEFLEEAAQVGPGAKYPNFDFGR